MLTQTISTKHKQHYRFDHVRTHLVQSIAVGLNPSTAVDSFIAPTLNYQKYAKLFEPFLPYLLC